MSRIVRSEDVQHMKCRVRLESKSIWEHRVRSSENRREMVVPVVCSCFLSVCFLMCVSVFIELLFCDE